MVANDTRCGQYSDQWLPWHTQWPMIYMIFHSDCTIQTELDMNTSTSAQFRRNWIWTHEQVKIKTSSFRQFVLTSRAPPWTFFMPIMLRGSNSSSIITASTTMQAKKSLECATSFELSAVEAHFFNNSRCCLKTYFKTRYLLNIYDLTPAKRWTWGKETSKTCTMNKIYFI